MQYRDKVTGTIHNVTNKTLFAQYEGNERFEKIVPKPPKASTTTKKK